MKAKVLIILPSDKFLHRQILEGVLAYGHAHGPWQFHFETGSRYEQGLAKLRRWGCSGVIALVRERRQMNRILATKTPAVLINPPTPPCGAASKPPKRTTFIARVQEDVGKSAAEYFLDRGFRSFAFVGTPEPSAWCERRLKGMRNRLAAAGLECNAFPGAPKGEREDFDRESAHLAEWLRSLKPQTALYAAWDRRALQILSLCSELDIAVPESLSVLGTDNDEVLCESSTPSLSSIALDGRNAGILCAKLLDAHMNGRKAEPLVDLAFPRIVTRQSTDKTVVPDAYLAKPFNPNVLLVRVEKLISQRQQLRELYSQSILSKDANVIENPLSENDQAFLDQISTLVRSQMMQGQANVESIASQLCLSSKQLRRKLYALTGETTVAYIMQIRLAEAHKMLMSDPAMPVSEVAMKCGFEDGGYFTKAFKQQYGMTPTQLRQGKNS